jgi:hypothetical protein
VNPPFGSTDLATHRQAEWRPADTTVVLGPVLPVTGQVVDASGTPVAGAVVHGLQPSAPTPTWRTVADECGRFRVERIDLEEVDLVPLPPGTDSDDAPPGDPAVRAEPGDEMTLVLTSHR